MSYTNPLHKPACYADPALHNLATAQCKICVHSAGCAEAVAAKARIEAIKKGTYQPGSLARPGAVPVAPPAAAAASPVVPGVLQPVAVQPLVTQPQTTQYTTTAQPQSQALAPTSRTAIAPVVTAANSSVVYEKAEGTAGRELLQRAALSGVAAVFEELGRFMRHDGYRLPIFQQPVRLIRCAACNHINEPASKFCSGCGRTFGSGS